MVSTVLKYFESERKQQKEKKKKNFPGDNITKTQQIST